MANLSLVYGLRLLPADELEQVGSGEITLKNGRREHVTLHLLEGSKAAVEIFGQESSDFPEIPALGDGTPAFDGIASAAFGAEALAVAGPSALSTVSCSGGGNVGAPRERLPARRIAPLR